MSRRMQQEVFDGFAAVLQDYSPAALAAGLAAASGAGAGAAAGGGGAGFAHTGRSEVDRLLGALLGDAKLAE